MAKMPLSRILLHLVINISYTLSVSGIEYGPSLSSLTGVFVNFKGPDLFSIESGRNVQLQNYPGYAAVLPLITGESTATSEQIFQERGISTVGEFTVEAPHGFGIIVVIQELKLRKTRDRGNVNATISCSDYIQFGETRTNGNVSRTSKICGTVLKDDLNLNPQGLLGPRTFKIKTSRMRITFNHAYVAELVDSLLGSKQKHSLKAEIAFTAFKVNCGEEVSSINSNNSTVTEINLEEESFEVCSDYTKSVNQTCISSKLICDEIYNCGGDGETLGSDDNSITCPDKPVRTTEIPPPEDTFEKDNKQDSLSNLATYLGIPSLAPYSTKKYERRFRPGYVSSQQSSSGSGHLFDYTSRRTTESLPSSTESISPVVEVDQTKPSESNNVKSVENSAVQDLSGDETEIFNRRELSHAINSVIYGVAVFIIFTIFITVFVVCLTKKIQTTWNARVARSSSIDNDPNRRRVSTPSIIPNTTTTVITHNSTVAGCDPTSPGDMTFSPQNTTVVLLTLPQSVETYDLPPSYDTLFPTSRS